MIEVKNSHVNLKSPCTYIHSINIQKSNFWYLKCYAGEIEECLRDK